MRIVTVMTTRIGEPGAYEYLAAAQPINLADDEAERLLLRGLATRSHGAIRENDILFDAIVDAIDDLKVDDFGKDGKPAVKAIEGILGENISATERDQAWTHYQNLQHDG